MSTDWGSATDAKGARISLLHDDKTPQVCDRSFSNSSRQQIAVLPPISPLLNVSYPGSAQTSIKRSLNISTASQDPPYYAQPTPGSSVSSPQATTPGFSEYNSAPASTYSPSHIHSALDPSLTSSSYIRDRPTFSRPGSFSLPRDSVPRGTYPPITSERLYGSQGQLGYSASPPSMSDRTYQAYMRRGDDLRRSESYGTTSSGSANSSMDSEGPFTPQDEMPSWGGRHRLLHSSSTDAYPSLLGKRSRDERDGEFAGGYQYPPPPEETRYEERYEDPYTREYKPRVSSYNYPPPPAPYRELSYATPALAPSYLNTSGTSSRNGHIRTQPTRSSSLRQPLTSSSHATGSSQSSDPTGLSTPSATNPKKFPCRFLHTPPIYCTQTFTTSGHASRHAKIHKEEKGISCVYPGCGKRFTRGDNMKQHLETHFRVRGGRGKKDSKSKNEDANEGDKESRAEMQRLLREGAEKRERERGVRDGRRREREEMDMSMSVSPRTIRGGRLEIEEGKREAMYYNAPSMDALDALATIAVGRK